MQEGQQSYLTIISNLRLFKDYGNYVAVDVVINDKIYTLINLNGQNTDKPEFILKNKSNS